MCKSCEVVSINGVNCHETGCPDAWETEVRECDECGTDFVPDTKYQKQCIDCEAEAHWLK
jgi:hypothetical protein